MILPYFFLVSTHTRYLAIYFFFQVETIMFSCESGSIQTKKWEISPANLTFKESI